MMRLLFVLIDREIVEGIGVIDGRRVIVEVPLARFDCNRKSAGARYTEGHTLVFAKRDRGIKWADAANDEEANAFRAFVALR